MQRDESSMGLYKMYTPLEEQLIRNVCSKGVPTNTHWNHSRHHRTASSPCWIEYSTIAL